MSTGRGELFFISYTDSTGENVRDQKANWHFSSQVTGEAVKEAHPNSQSIQGRNVRDGEKTNTESKSNVFPIRAWARLGRASKSAFSDL